MSDINITIPFGQTVDQKIGSLGSKAQVSIWYAYDSAHCYLQNDSEDDLYLTVAYYDGTLIPNVGEILNFDRSSTIILDQKNPTQNNQQLAISNCSISMPDEVVLFDYNNVCVYNDYVKQNTILMSVVTANNDENTLQ